MPIKYHNCGWRSSNESSFRFDSFADISPRISAEPTESSQTSGLGSSSSFRQKSSVSSVSAESGVLMSATSESDGDHTPNSSCNPVCVTQVRLEYEQQKERVARSQIQFLKSQLASETAARVDAQVCLLPFFWVYLTFWDQYLTRDISVT